MDHTDHVNLIKKGIPDEAGIWADLGAGRGAFTLALADCLPDGSRIIAVDTDARALKTLEGRLELRYPHIDTDTLQADFTHPLRVPELDGVLMANSLHFVQDKLPVLQQIRTLLKPGGRFVLVEYDVAQGNYAVPHPLTYTMWSALAAEVGFSETVLLATRPSSFMGSFFSALSINHNADH